MRWTFLLTTSDAPFFASDNPARLMSPGAKPLKIKVGELNEELEISFPISDTCVLWMHSHDIIQNPHIGFNDVTKIDTDVANKINLAILPTIDRYTYCSIEKQAYWVLEQIYAK
jgi:hypothetical protein